MCVVSTGGTKGKSVWRGGRKVCVSSSEQTVMRCPSPLKKETSHFLVLNSVILNSLSRNQQMSKSGCIWSGEAAYDELKTNLFFNHSDALFVFFK